ncbi:hypothetical protein AB0J51_04020 [Micromonospora echinofusca]|uniref:hypothetical protein n=1 Tax=Micromonospora echinofusca TaxID=47858 RepID=UPI003416BAD5
MSNSGPDWIARGTALAGLLVALGSLTWQWYSWRRSGPLLRVKADQHAQGPLAISVFNRGRADVEIGLICVQWRSDKIHAFGPFVRRVKILGNLSVEELPLTIKAGHSASFRVEHAEVPGGFYNAVWRLERSARVILFTPVGKFKGRADVEAAESHDMTQEFLSVNREIIRSKAE